MCNKEQAQILILTAIQGCMPAPYNKTAQQLTETDYQYTRRFITRFLAKTEEEFNIKAPPIKKEPTGR